VSTHEPACEFASDADVRKTKSARGRLERPQRLSTRTPHVGFFHFLFSSFLLSTFFLIHKLCAQLIFVEKVMHTTRRLQKKLWTQLVVREKIYAQVILQVIVHTSCMHRFARIKLILKNYLTKFISRSYAPNCVYKL
jgi:hypothetical protein